ncbi:hypothetical protein ACE193_06285 [Bernardetia sp. OM2101]|uniref:hypothetical protein n=1 Tax=Bernardetia sp. OM2101 TaxID=3344876 RepID=UPI0035CEC4E3
MKKINVEANKSFYQGFVLSEQELRRFNDLIQEQLKKEESGDIQNSFSVIFENGVVAETYDIEEIFIIENSGSSKIVKLEVVCEILDTRRISLEFTNTDSANASTEVSIRYNINGLTRDWVFVTSSLIEERIKKIKRWNLSYDSKGRKYRHFSVIIIPLFMLIPLIFLVFGGFTKRSDTIKEIRADYESGKLTEPIEALLRIQESGQSLEGLNPLKYIFAALGVLIISVITIYFYFLWLYPVYNFCWGDYLETFRKRESLRKTVNTVVIIGLVISVVGGLIANYIGK